MQRGMLHPHVKINVNALTFVRMRISQKIINFINDNYVLLNSLKCTYVYVG